MLLQKNKPNFMFPGSMSQIFSYMNVHLCPLAKNVHLKNRRRLQTQEQLCQTSRVNTFWFSQECTFYTKKVMAILKFQFACNYSVNLNFDSQYLWNTRSDLHFFFNLFVFCSSFMYVEKLMSLPLWSLVPRGPDAFYRIKKYFFKPRLQNFEILKIEVNMLANYKLDFPKMDILKQIFQQSS